MACFSSKFSKLINFKDYSSFWKTIVWSFHYQYRNVNPFMESFRDEKFTTRHKRHNPIPHSWLSSCGKIEIPHSRLRRSWGISISPRLLSHSWGIGISLLWLVVNFQFLHLRLRRSCRNYPVPETFHKWIGSFIWLEASIFIYRSRATTGRSWLVAAPLRF